MGKKLCALHIVVACQTWIKDARVMEKSWNLNSGKRWEPCPSICVLQPMAATAPPPPDQNEWTGRCYKIYYLPFFNNSYSETESNESLRCEY